jgi:hypothetical protein
LEIQTEEIGAAVGVWYRSGSSVSTGLLCGIGEIGNVEQVSYAAGKIQQLSN